MWQSKSRAMNPAFHLFVGRLQAEFRLLSAHSKRQCLPAITEHLTQFCVTLGHGRHDYIFSRRFPNVMQVVIAKQDLAASCVVIAKQYLAASCDADVHVVTDPKLWCGFNCLRDQPQQTNGRTARLPDFQLEKVESVPFIQLPKRLGVLCNYFARADRNDFVRTRQLGNKVRRLESVDVRYGPRRVPIVPARMPPPVLQCQAVDAAGPPCRIRLRLNPRSLAQ